MRLLAEEAFHDFLDFRHTGHAADEDDFVDLAGPETGVLQRLAARLDGALDEIVDQRFEFGAREFQREMLRTRRIGGDVRQVDFGLRRRGEFDLRLFRRLFQALKSELVLLQVDARLFLEFVVQVIDDALVEVLAAEERVAVRRLHFEHAVADLEDRTSNVPPPRS